MYHPLYDWAKYCRNRVERSLYDCFENSFKNGRNKMDVQDSTWIIGLLPRSRLSRCDQR